MDRTASTRLADTVGWRCPKPPKTPIDLVHFQGPAAARARSMAIDILPAVASLSTATAPLRYSRRCRLGFSDVIQATRGAVLCCGSRAFLSFFVAIAVVVVGAAEPSVVVDGIALVFRLPRFF